MKSAKQIIARENGRKLNIQITNQLIANGIMSSFTKYTGKTIEDVEDLEWIKWIKELMIIRDNFWNESEN
jgi:hypothetical protein